MNNLEILAPAGSFESVYAAARCGANAVYLGLKQFSARAKAQNFTVDELKQVTNYCHERNVAVYLTVNTLIFDDELKSAVELIKAAAKANIDAVIVQDIGLASLIKKAIPDLPLHASTQMSVHSPSGAKALYEMGFKRVVVSRELSKDEIAEIVKSCPIEIEVFVHGALCMCISGQCYFSAMLGSRSGNRGLCAQPCRLPFNVKGGNGYALSLKDNSLINYLRELKKIGVCSAKIEGRMKRPEYTAATVKACAESLKYGFVTDKTQKLLGSVFSRTGFTDGYYLGKRGYDMFGYRQKEDVLKTDNQTLKEIRALYKDEPKNICIEFDLTVKANTYPVLTACDGINTVSALGDEIPQAAKNIELTKEKCIAQLQKTGSTPYKADKINVNIDNGLSLAVSQINMLRRKCIEMLSNSRIKNYDYKINDIDIDEFLSLNRKIGSNSKLYKKAPETRIRLTNSNFSEELLDFDLVFVPLFSPIEKIQLLIEKGINVGCEIPRGMFGTEKHIVQRLKLIKRLNIKNILASNIGAVYIAKNIGFNVCGGFGLNLTNTASLVWAQNYGICDVELSFELTKRQIESLGSSIKKGIISYGYLPLMLVRNCPNKNGNNDCKNCKNAGKLQDRLQKSFFFQCQNGCVEILNGTPLIMLEKINDFCNLDFHVYRESVENYVENVENIRCFIRKNLKNKNLTYGLYYRGVN